MIAIFRDSVLGNTANDTANFSSIKYKGCLENLCQTLIQVRGANYRFVYTIVFGSSRCIEQAQTAHCR